MCVFLSYMYGFYAATGKPRSRACLTLGDVDTNASNHNARVKFVDSLLTPCQYTLHNLQGMQYASLSGHRFSRYPVRTNTC